MTGADSSTKPDDGILITWRESPPAVKALIIGFLVNSLGAFVPVFLVLFMTEERGFANVQAGFALGAYAFGAVVGVIVGGALSDRFGPRTMVVASTSVTAALILGILYVDEYGALIAVVALVGAANASYRPAARTLITDVTPRHRQIMVSAMYRLAMNTGMIAAPIIGAALVSVSYDLLFWGEAAILLVWGAGALLFLPASSAKRPPKDRSGGYAAVLQDRRFTVFLIALFVNSLVYMQHLSALPIAMRDQGLDISWYASMIAINGAIVISCELIATKFVQRLPLRIIVVLGFALLGGGMACYALPFGVAVFVVGTLVWSLAEVIAGPTMFAYPGMAGPKRLRGRYIGSSSAMFGIGSAVGPAVGVATYELIGPSLWWVCGLVCLVGIAAGVWGMRSPAELERIAAEDDAADAAQADNADATATPTATATGPATAGSATTAAAAPAATTAAAAPAATTADATATDPAAAPGVPAAADDAR